MRVHAVLFDLGGVILRTEYQAPREHLAERLHVTYEDLDKIVFGSETARLASLGTISTAQHWAAVIWLGLPASQTDQIREEFFAGDVLDRDVLEFVRALRPRRKTGLISNGWPDLREYISRQHFADAFDNLVISAEVGMMKPAREIYELALHNLDVEHSLAALVDDAPENVGAASQLGMHGICSGPAQCAASWLALDHDQRRRAENSGAGWILRLSSLRLDRTRHTLRWARGRVSRPMLLETGSGEWSSARQHRCGRLPSPSIIIATRLRSDRKPETSLHRSHARL
jgi:HAD superfamily hydrolase (TIGR01509 family)